MLRVLKRRSKDSLFNNGMKDNEADILQKKMSLRAYTLILALRKHRQMNSCEFEGLRLEWST